MVSNGCIPLTLVFSSPPPPPPLFFSWNLQYTVVHGAQRMSHNDFSDPLIFNPALYVHLSSKISHLCDGFAQIFKWGSNVPLRINGNNFGDHTIRSKFIFVLIAGFSTKYLKNNAIPISLSCTFV